VEDIEKQTRVENGGGKRESFWRSTCVLFGTLGRGTFIRIQKRKWVEAEEEEDGREEVDSRR
jgi:hypothetical protein